MSWSSLAVVQLLCHPRRAACHPTDDRDCLVSTMLPKILCSVAARRPRMAASSRSRPCVPTSTRVSGRPMISAALCGQAVELVVRLLGEPDHAGVVAEVVVAQLGVAVESELDDDGAEEGLHEEVGEHVRARLVLEELRQPLRRRRRRRSSAGRRAAACPAGRRRRRARRRCRSRRTPRRHRRTRCEAPPRAARPRRRSGRDGCAAAGAADGRRPASRARRRSPCRVEQSPRRRSARRGLRPARPGRRAGRRIGR